MQSLQNLSDYDSIIFDLGGVIINLDFERTLVEFRKHIIHMDESVFLGREKQLSFFSDYEVGKITTIEFVLQFNDHYGLNLGLSSFQDCWNAMILDFPLARIKLLQRLSQAGKKIYLLSNINEMHEHAVDARFKLLGLDFSFFSLFNKVYYSHHIGRRKPNQDCFELVVKENSLNKKSTLFIDDSIQHIHGALSIGLDAYHLKRPESLENLSLFLK